MNNSKFNQLVRLIIAEDPRFHDDEAYEYAMLLMVEEGPTHALRNEKSRAREAGLKV